MSGFVYAIAAESRVKIGWSSDPMRRLVKIRSDCPGDATLIGVIPATRAQECEVHAELAPWRINGEWFDLSANAVAAFVSMLPKAEPKPIRRYGKGRAHPLAQFRADHGMSLEQFAALFGVNKSTVLRWEENQVPAERTLDIERQTGISRHLLRPDLYPETEAV